MKQNKQLFHDTYEVSKDQFINSLSEVKKYWSSARLIKKQIGNGEEDLSIDIIEAEAIEEKKQLLILTTGLHGVEGYVGAAVLQLFIEEFLSAFNPLDTGIVLVHAINPWGMKHKRRFNQSNVDLNRNFIFNWEKLDLGINHQYRTAEPFFNPLDKIKSGIENQANFTFSFIKMLTRLGVKGISNALLLGQYEFSKGIYFGGEGYEENTSFMIDLYRNYIAQYEEIVLLDIHTGYGPSNQMSIVNSGLEKKSSEELSKLFSYPLVQKTNPEEFYAINGDMMDYLYSLQHEEFPNKDLYAAAFEFGTLGESLIANIKSLKALILENQLYWNGSTDQKQSDRVKEAFLQLFYPSEPQWRDKAVADARQAFEGILKVRNFID